MIPVADILHDGLVLKDFDFWILCFIYKDYIVADPLHRLKRVFSALYA